MARFDYCRCVTTPAFITPRALCFKIVSDAKCHFSSHTWSKLNHIHQNRSKYNHSRYWRACSRHGGDQQVDRVSVYAFLIFNIIPAPTSRTSSSQSHSTTVHVPLPSRKHCCAAHRTILSKHLTAGSRRQRIISCACQAAMRQRSGASYTTSLTTRNFPTSKRGELA